MEEFQLSKFAKEGEQLLREVTDEFNRLGIDAANLPKIFPDDSGKIKLVFVGQYSAGKSSIIKMLTGEDVEIGAAITTQNFTPYEWNGLEIIDTPGIHTELRPDHDEITYEQINHAALLIFVITNEGFSRRMGEHFCNLVTEQKRAANMILVVNKMDRTALGNVPEQQKIIREDLKKVTEPYDLKALYLSFLDTQSWFDSLEEKDPELKAELVELSGRDIFIANLNRFVAKKGVLQKINLPLNTIAAEIVKVAGNASEGGKDADAVAEIERKRKGIFDDDKDACLNDVNILITNFKGDIKTYGREVAEDVLAQKSEEDAEKVIGAAKERIKKMAADCAAKIETCTKNFVDKTEADIKAYDGSTFAQKVNANLQSRFAAQESDSNGGGAVAIGGGGLAAGFALAEHGSQLAQFAMPAVTPLGEFVGSFVQVSVSTFLAEDAGIFSTFIASQASYIIKGLPIFQTELTFSQRLASFVAGNARLLGAGLAVAGMVFSIWMTHRDGEKAKEREKARQATRESIIANFDEAAEKIGGQMLGSVNKWMTEKIDPIIATFDEKVNEIESAKANDKIKSEKLSALLKRTNALKDAIQACQM